MFTKLKRSLRHNKYVWKYGLNRGPSFRFLFSPQRIEGQIKRIVNDLNKKGIAFSSIDELFADKDLFIELKEAVKKLESDSKETIEQARQNVNNPTTDLGDKVFMQFLLGINPKFDPQSIWYRFAIQEAFQQIANAYFEMKEAEMRYYNVWYNIPFRGEPRASQLWHRDWDDMQILKIFVYFNDVGPGGGPLSYAPDTHLKGTVKKNPKYRIESNYKRTRDDQMAEVISPENWVTGTAKKFDIIFADTHGYHKGGHALESDRLLYTCMYLSPASTREMFSF